MIREVDHPAKRLRVLANPIKVNGQRLDQSPCSQFGADNDAYLPAAERAATP
jgi:hypothetical protein